MHKIHKYIAASSTLYIICYVTVVIPEYSFQQYQKVQNLLLLCFCTVAVVHFCYYNSITWAGYKLYRGRRVGVHFLFVPGPCGVLFVPEPVQFWIIFQLDVLDFCALFMF
jgi:hypothetical protein